MTATTLDKVQVDGLTIAYRELGSGPPVLLLHGWPTSSFLWRDVMAPIAERNRVVAIDLPGLRWLRQAARACRYDFDLFERTLDGFLAALGIEEVGLAVHDLGGPIGLHWARAPPGARDEAGAPEHARLSRSSPRRSCSSSRPAARPSCVSSSRAPRGSRRR